MFKITIDKNISLDELESYYQKLHHHINLDVFVDLSIPIRLTSNYVGLVPSLYQYVATWIRYPKSGKLILDIDLEDKANFEKLYENELIFPVVSMVWNKNGVFDKTGEHNLRSILKPFNTLFFEKMKNVLPLKKGGKLLLTNFDHLAHDKGILPCFEVNGSFIINESKLLTNISPAIEQILNYNSGTGKIFRYYQNDLIAIIYELMKNTFEWAKEDINGASLDPNIRGLYIHFTKKKKENLIEEFKTHRGLKKYFSSAELKPTGANNEILFLEISVFDSGSGFVKKFKSLNPSTDLSNIDIVKSCLVKHNTSAKGLESFDKGIGLDRILNVLDKKGFIKIKTGNVCIYRDLISQPYKRVDRNAVKEMELQDWHTNSRDFFSFPDAEGSVITIIYPFSVFDL